MSDIKGLSPYWLTNKTLFYSLTPGFRRTTRVSLSALEADNQKALRIVASLAEVEDRHKVAGSTTVDLVGLIGLDKGEAEAQIALEIADKIGLDLSDPKSWNEV